MCNFIFQSDCQVQLQPQIIPPNMEEYVNSLLTAVLPSVLNKFRIYLSLLRLLDYSISDEVTKVWKISLVDFSTPSSDRKCLNMLLYLLISLPGSDCWKFFNKEAFYCHGYVCLQGFVLTSASVDRVHTHPACKNSF